MKVISPFEYHSGRAFLADWISENQKSRPEFSIRAWAKTADVSHTLIVLLLQGKRPLRARHGMILAQAMGLPSAERVYFQTLIELDNAKSIEQRELISGWLRELNPGQTFTFKEVEEYRLFARWEHMAILAMLQLQNPPASPEAAYAKFGGEQNRATTLNEVRSAWERLLNLGLMREGAADQAPTATFSEISCRDDVANRGAREYHRQSAELAKGSIEAQTLDERELQSFTLAIDARDLPAMKETIRRFRAKLTRDFSRKPTANEVYQMNLHFFRLTERPLTRDEDEAAAMKPTTVRKSGDKL